MRQKALRMTASNKIIFKNLLERLFEENKKIKGNNASQFVKRMKVLQPIEREIRRFGLQVLHSTTEKEIEQTVREILKDLSDGKIKKGYCNEDDLGERGSNFGTMPSYAEIHGVKTRLRVNSLYWIDTSESAIENRKIQKYWNDGYCEGIPL